MLFLNGLESRPTSIPIECSRLSESVGRSEQTRASTARTDVAIVAGVYLPLIRQDEVTHSDWETLGEARGKK